MKEKKEQVAVATSVPHKPTVNLALREDHKNAVRAVALGAVAAVIIGFCVVKFGIIDQQANYAAAEATYAQVHAQNEALKTVTDTYNDVLREYRSASGTSVSEDEETILDRGEILDVVEKEIMSKASVKSLQISGNVVTLSMSGITLKDASAMLKTVETYSIVTKTTVLSAQTDDTAESDVLSNIFVTVYFAKEGE